MRTKKDVLGMNGQIDEAEAFKRLGGFVLAAMASIAGYFLATTWKFLKIRRNGSGDGNREQILLVGDSLTQRGFDSKKGWVSNSRRRTRDARTSSTEAIPGTTRNGCSI